MRFLVAALAGLLGGIGVAAAEAPPPVMFTHTSYIVGNVVISPDGKHVALSRGKSTTDQELITADYVNGNLVNLRQLNLNDLIPTGIAFKTNDRLIVSVVKRNRLVVGAYTNNTKDSPLVDTQSVLAVNIDGSNIKLLMSSQNPSVALANILVKKPGHVLLLAVGQKNGAASLYDVDIDSGSSNLVERGLQNTGSFLTNIDGVPYARFDVDDRTQEEITMFRAQGGDWTEFQRKPLIEQSEGGGVEGMASPTSVYVTARAGDDRRAVWVYDLNTRKPLRKMLDIPSGEAEGIRIDHYRGDFTGATYVSDGLVHTIYTNKAFAAAQKVLDDSFPEYPVNQIIGYSQDLGVYVVASQGPTQPPVFLLLDARTMQATQIAYSSTLDPATLGKTQVIKYPSSDGKIITAYLTIPAGASKNVPLIVMPHGGPEASDDLNYDPWRTFFSSRGYAVLQPQYRGSDGFGHAFEASAHGNWGTTVQDDLTYGVQKVIAMGIADPKHMCIFGWSYGGYMAMASLTMHPDLFKCVVAGAGISDVDQMLAWESRMHGSQSTSFEYWHDRMGDGDAREKASPINFVKQAKAPLLLVHGEVDLTVPIEQSEKMDSALQSLGKSVEFLRLPHQRHSPEHDAEAQALERIGTFVAKNIQ